MVTQNGLFPFSYYPRVEINMNGTVLAESMLSTPRDDLTFRVEEPFNKRLPMANQNDMFLSLDI